MNRALLAIRTAAAVLLISSCSAQAQTVTDPPGLQNDKLKFAYIASPAMLQVMQQLGIREDKKLGIQQDCQSGYQTKLIRVNLLKPIEFSEGARNPTQDKWMTRYNLSRCGETKTYNAIFFADPKGEKPVARSFLPGSPNASLPLITDAMLLAVTNAALKVKGCEKYLVFDMRVVGAANNVADGARAWKELWTFDICGQLVNVPVTFIPTVGRGTSFFVDASKVGITSPDATQQKP